MDLRHQSLIRRSRRQYSRACRKRLKQNGFVCTILQHQQKSGDQGPHLCVFRKESRTLNIRKVQELVGLYHRHAKEMLVPLVGKTRWLAEITPQAAVHCFAGA